MTKEKKKYQPLTSELVFLVYEILQESSFVSFPAPNDAENKVESVVNTINNSHFGHTPYSTMELKASAILFFLIKAHAFTDGNKRTAVSVFHVYCELNSLDVAFPVNKLDEVAVYVEQYQGNEHQDFIRKLAVLLFSL